MFQYLGDENMVKNIYLLLIYRCFVFFFQDLTRELFS